jgi:23S rRNA pseudouridine2604 synthase
MTYPSESKRLNKAIGESGYCSRRQADTLIEQGKVYVNGNIAGLGDRVLPSDQIVVEGTLITKSEKTLYIALNKPVGITCTTDTRIKDNVVDFIGHKERIFHIGRLDKPSEGLLLMTNDGDIVNKILRSGNKHEKEYIVKVDRRITDEFLQRMCQGVPILDTITKKCKVEKVGRYVFKIILIQGLNRQIRRMCEYLGYEVVSLKRIRIMNIELGDLSVGKWRYLNETEIKDLKMNLENSLNTPQNQRGFN